MPPSWLNIFKNKRDISPPVLRGKSWRSRPPLPRPPTPSPPESPRIPTTGLASLAQGSFLKHRTKWTPRRRRARTEEETKARRRRWRRWAIKTGRLTGDKVMTDIRKFMAEQKEVQRVAEETAKAKLEREADAIVAAAMKERQEAEAATLDGTESVAEHRLRLTKDNLAALASSGVDTIIEGPTWHRGNILGYPSKEEYDEVTQALARRYRAGVPKQPLGAPAKLTMANLAALESLPLGHVDKGFVERQNMSTVSVLGDSSPPLPRPGMPVARPQSLRNAAPLPVLSEVDVSLMPAPLRVNPSRRPQTLAPASVTHHRPQAKRDVRQQSQSADAEPPSPRTSRSSRQPPEPSRRAPPPPQALHSSQAPRPTRAPPPPPQVYKPSRAAIKSPQVAQRTARKTTAELLKERRGMDSRTREKSRQMLAPVYE
ncbi:hypothetical protein BDV95DRAFT_607745 [Massariosphaeria phaeospora]|uniref:Uncharacterized protein n=1 Tax=Massariosphaeria phaeospora TaxID=100035 RepID=A0A7C8I866_9PLEO|nr:hypothetical protein BDV95DRAFT_607745 [Massariosphaeria phaeospora]